jgi:predicted nuclease of restriction endonuclease-like (RecB) superfamily
MKSKLTPQQVPGDEGFDAIVGLIETARQRAFQAVNTTLIDLYWQIGEHISHKIAAAQWGDGVVTQLAAHIAHRQPGLRGFTRRNLFRMRQFFEAYTQTDVTDQKVPALARQLPWTHNLAILNQCKRAEERDFYLRMAIQEQWSSRDLERQLKAALFERAMLQPARVSAALTQMHPQAVSTFKDAYVIEFLGLPDVHSEADLQRGLLNSLKAFLIELGRDFCFVGSKFPLQVGGRDFALDLLFYPGRLHHPPHQFRATGAGGRAVRAG